MIYKLKYNSEAESIADLTEKGVIGSKKTHAIVYIGLIMDTPPVLDEDMNVIEEATFLDGYHVDIMTDDIIEFTNALTPNNPKHTFAGW